MFWLPFVMSLKSPHNYKSFFFFFKSMIICPTVFHVTPGFKTGKSKFLLRKKVLEMNNVAEQLERNRAIICGFSSFVHDRP